MNHVPPSADPADDDSLAGTLRHVVRKALMATENCLPARVVAFDRDKNRATVQPLVALVTTGATQMQRAQIASVPVMQFGGGGVVLNFNMQPGDLGWIVAADRDISNFLQAYTASPPNTYRIHSFQDAVFVPDVMRGWTIAEEDAEAAVLQTLDGTAKVSLKPGQLKLTVGGKSVTVSAAGTTITGGLVVDGIAFGTHRHPENDSGGPTDGPIN